MFKKIGLDSGNLTSIEMSSGCGLDTSKLVGLTFIDLKKAYDTVGHVIFCRK